MLSSPRHLPSPHSTHHHQQSSTSPPDHHLFPLLRTFNSPFELKQLHAHLLKTSSPLSLLPLPRVASLCAFSPPSTFAYARQIFRHVEENSEIVLWNSCLKTFAESDCPKDVISLFYRLREFDVFPDSFTLSFVLKACMRLSDVENGRIAHGYVEKLGFSWNMFLQNSILHLYASSGEMGDAQLMFDKMPQRDVVSWNIMMTQLIKRDNVDHAYEMFVEMPKKNVRSWTLMIAGFVRCEKPKEAVNLFLEMEKVGVEPNEATVVAVLIACADLGELFLCRRIHEYLNQSGFLCNVHVSNTLIDLYVKCGCLEDAQGFFDKMEERIVVSWLAMMTRLAMHSEAKEALKLFTKMIEVGMKPNGVTFIGLLHACSHMGLVDQGRNFFAGMTHDHGIVPRIEHYGCMVDLLSTARLLKGLTSLS